MAREMVRLKNNMNCWGPWGELFSQNDLGMLGNPQGEIELLMLRKKRGQCFVEQKAEICLNEDHTLGVSTIIVGIFTLEAFW